MLVFITTKSTNVSILKAIPSTGFDLSLIIHDVLKSEVENFNSISKYAYQIL